MLRKVAFRGLAVLGVLVAASPALGQSPLVVLYDDFDDGDYNGWTPTSAVLGAIGEDPDVVVSPEGYALKGIGSGYPCHNAPFAHPLVLDKVNELSFAMRSRSGSGSCNQADVALLSSDSFYRGIHYGQHGKALFNIRVNGQDFWYWNGPPIGGDWHDLEWVRDADGWWSLYVDGEPWDVDFVQENALHSFDNAFFNVTNDQSEIEWVRINAAAPGFRDCNDNGIPDESDIAQGTSQDCNANEIPDECDIAEGTSADCQQNGVPDECDIADPGNLTPGDLLVSSFLSREVLRYEGPLSSGSPGAFVEVYIDLNDPPTQTRPYFFTFGPDGNIYLSSSEQNGINGVLRYVVATGALEVFVQPGSGGLFGPKSLTFGPDGHLYVCSGDSESINQYDGETGAPLPGDGYPGCDPTGTAYFVCPETGGPEYPLNHPNDLLFHGELLYVSGQGAGGSPPNYIFRFDADTGEFVDVIAETPVGHAIDGLSLGPDGKLYATNAAPADGAVLRYMSEDGGQTWVADPSEQACATGTAYFVCPGSGGFANPRGRPVFGPDGNLYVCSVHTNEVLRYDGQTGEFIDVFVAAGSGGLNEPFFCAFVPGTSMDCNQNGVPDECDIAEGTSADCQPNSIPDECELMGNDCNSNGTPDDCEADFDGDDLIDECDPDIDNDGVLNEPDVCDYTPLTVPHDLVEPNGTVRGDLDEDCDVDLVDYAMFQVRFTNSGPNG